MKLLESASRPIELVEQAAARSGGAARRGRGSGGEHGSGLCDEVRPCRESSYRRRKACTAALRARCGGALALGGVDEADGERRELFLPTTLSHLHNVVARSPQVRSLLLCAPTDPKLVPPRRAVADLGPSRSPRLPPSPSPLAPASAPAPTCDCHHAPRCTLLARLDRPAHPRTDHSPRSPRPISPSSPPSSLLTHSTPCRPAPPRRITTKTASTSTSLSRRARPARRSRRSSASPPSAAPPSPSRSRSGRTARPAPRCVLLSLLSKVFEVPVRASGRRGRVRARSTRRPLSS